MSCVLIGIQMFSFQKVDALSNTPVTPEQYGANGKDKLDDTKALQKALDSSKQIVLKGGSTYYINAPLKVNHTISITTSGGKANIVKTTMKQKENAFHFENLPIKQTMMKSSVKKGQLSINVTDASGIKAGDLVHLQSSKLWRWDNRGYLAKGELLQVKSVKGNTIEVETPLRDSYALSGEKVTVKSYANKRLILKNVSFSYPKVFDSGKELVRIDGTTNAVLEGVEVKHSKRLGILLDKTYGTLVNKANVDLGTTPDISSGYGVQDYGGIYNKITNSYFTNVRRGIDFSGVTPSRFGYAGYNKAVGPVKYTLASGNSGFGTHSTAEDILFEKNEAVNFTYSFLSRGNRIVFKENKASGSVRAFLVVSYGDNVKAYKNTYQSNNGGNLEQFLRIASTYDGGVTLQSNYGGVIRQDFVQNDSEKVKFITLFANRGVFIQKSKGASYLVRSVKPIQLYNSSIKGNSMTMREGKKLLFYNVNASDKSNQIDGKY